MKAIILMAGVGSRLGRSLPKCLLELPNGETILGRQIRLLKPYCSEIIGVVGFKKEIIMEMFPKILYVYNPFFIQTNTAKSLLMAMESIAEDDILWFNGDVVFNEIVLQKLLKTPGNAIGVEFRTVGDEEIKFTLDSEGYVREISKTVKGGLGEAVGINKVSREAFEGFKMALEKCDNGDYFERAIELCARNGIRFKAVDIGQDQCVEVDFIEDLDRAWRIVGNNSTSDSC